MPPTPVPPEQLRQRAATMRRVAASIERSSALDLYRRAGDDVWQGPTPRRCLDDLIGMRTSLLRAAEELRTCAQVLDLRATQLG